MNVEQLQQAAGAAANDGRWADAERLWGEVLRLEPQNPRALFSLGFHALQRNEFATAIARLKAALDLAPKDILAWHTLGIASGRANDIDGERAAIDATLALDPYFLPGLLARAGWNERAGFHANAEADYGNALKIAPVEAHWPPGLKPQLEHAKALVARRVDNMHATLSAKLSPLVEALTPSELERWREAVSTMSGRTQSYPSLSNQLGVPRLPAIPFFDRSMFPWAAEIEAKTDVIRQELLAALAEDGQDFAPYIGYRPGDPVNQWQELNHSKRWSAYQLWRGGAPVEEHLRRCPETAKALQLVEMAEIGGLCPNAMFSALAPHTQIPPHHGETNARLVVHLPLIVPPNCTYRVGFERREWRVGELLFFDDTIEHEARNDSDELRVVLIFDVWNPLLSAAERKIVQALAAGAREYAASRQGPAAG